MEKKTATSSSTLTVVGLMLMVVGLVNQSQMPERVFGVSGGLVSGFLMGLALGVTLFAVVKAQRARKTP
ncbi:hypothetical protein ACO2Q0_08135 [Phenylobacterium sp. VNQ135]|uniref:hypothetical protein n=1 Tax=Phenylobacterium sp. VNQ135 TaxID=3400922 RepID=UPI003C0F91B0